MARIAGVNIPSDKRVHIALTYIYGIGSYNAEKIVKKIGIDLTRRVKDLSDQEILSIRECIDSEFKVEGDLRRDVTTNIKRLQDLGCLRGLRHRKRLPTRGQRTKTNARTRKGRRVAIPGKKQVGK